MPPQESPRPMPRAPIGGWYAVGGLLGFAGAVRERRFWMLPLLNRATNLRKHRTGIRANQSHHAGDDHKDDSQHDGVFRDVLPVGLLP